MSFVFDGRLSDSRFVEMIWRTRSEGGGSFTSTAASHWEMVVTKQKDGTIVSLRGPETTASLAPIPEDAEFFGIVFKHGTFMPHLPVSHLVDGAVHLPVGVGRSFWLHGSTWELPDYENADTFVDRLVLKVCWYTMASLTTCSGAIHLRSPSAQYGGASCGPPG